MLIYNSRDLCVCVDFSRTQRTLWRISQSTIYIKAPRRSVRILRVVNKALSLVSRKWPSSRCSGTICVV